MTMMVHGDERPTRARGGDFFAENAPVLDTIEFIEFLRCAGLSKMGATQCTNLRFYRWGLALSHPTPTRINLDFVAIYARPSFS
jgi:hypothetical protein